jgi:RNA polymerase sigma-70 factor (ECF subfamily)
VSDHRTTAAVQRYLNELAGIQGASPAEPIIRELLDSAVNRLHLLCANLLHRKYPRLMQGPLNLQSDEVLGGVIERLLKALRGIRPQNVRQFFALANQHMRWELNDLARRLDERALVVELRESSAPAPAEPSSSPLTPNTRRILEAIEGLPEDEREVFSLVRIQGMSHSEAAEVIGIAVKTVQRRLNRGLGLLSAKLDDMQIPARPGPAQ